MRELLAPDLIAWVTNADGEADRVTGREEYLRRIAAMDLPGAQYRVTLTQSPAAIDDHLLLLMVEVQAERKRPAAAKLRCPRATRGRRSSHTMADGRRQAGRKRSVLVLTKSDLRGVGIKTACDVTRG